MENSNAFAIGVGKKLLEEYAEIKPLLKEGHVYTSSDVARMCKLASNVTFYLQTADFAKFDDEARSVFYSVRSINEEMDAILTGREPFQAVPPPEDELG